MATKRRLLFWSILVLTLLILGGGCYAFVSRHVYYGYCVPGDDPGLQFSQPYFGGRELACEFTSTLFERATRPEPWVQILLEHLRGPYYEHEHYVESVITFNAYGSADLEIDPEAIRLEHRLPDGTALAPRGEPTFQTWPGGTSMYTVTYDLPLPESLVENISFEVMLDGKVVPIEYTFPLDYRFHYSILDALMGI